MCDKNINTLLNVDFSQVDDSVNWLHDSSNVLQTSGGKLIIDADSNGRTFTRQLGTFDNANDRVQIKCNIEAANLAFLGSTTMEATFEIWSGTQKLHTSCASFDSIAIGVNHNYFLDRTCKIDNSLSAPLTLKIIITEGFQYELRLEDLEVTDFNYCTEDIRTYFVIDQFLEDSLASVASAFQLESWKVDGVETLTPDFFNDNNSSGGNPLAVWKFANADLDGSNRVAENTSPKSFNPFVDELGLTFDTATSFHGGKPTAVTSGSNYGTGIMEIGILKPAILNGDLQVKNGAFFIDIDYTKSLKIEFNVVVNDQTSSVFSSPKYYRKYSIEWNPLTCEKKFYYTENGVLKDELVNGFLSGLTPVDVLETIIACDGKFSSSGQQGNFTFTIDFGTETGTAGINYNAYDIPDRFMIEWNGQTFDSGFVGSDTYDNDLINAGVSPSDINTGSPSTGSGTLTFTKTLASPSRAKITVLAPLGNTGWNITGVCPH